MLVVWDASGTGLDCKMRWIFKVYPEGGVFSARGVVPSAVAGSIFHSPLIIFSPLCRVRRYIAKRTRLQWQISWLHFKSRPRKKKYFCYHTLGKNQFPYLMDECDWICFIQMVQVETLMTGVVDRFPQVNKSKLRRLGAVICVCCCGLLLGLPCTSQVPITTLDVLVYHIYCGYPLN